VFICKIIVEFWIDPAGRREPIGRYNLLTWSNGLMPIVVVQMEMVYIDAPHVLPVYYRPLDPHHITDGPDANLDHPESEPRPGPESNPQNLDHPEPECKRGAGAPPCNLPTQPRYAWLVEAEQLGVGSEQQAEQLGPSPAPDWCVNGEQHRRQVCYQQTI
jgi:hypothetical protein